MGYITIAHDLEGLDTGLLHHVGPYVLMGSVVAGLIIAGYRIAVTTRCGACQGIVRRDATVCLHCDAPLG